MGKSEMEVVVPSYNHAPFIERCLKSIIQQTLPPSKLLVIDDGSTDASPGIIEAVLKDCSFPCELVVRENKGLCATLNEGLARTSGEFFAYLGSDDVWLPEFLEARQQLLRQRPNAVLGYGHGYLIDEDDRVIGCTLDWANTNYPDGDARAMLFRAIAPISSTVVYRRSRLDERRWNEAAKLEDYELYLQLAYDGEFALDRRVLSAWRWHDYNTSRDLFWMLQEVLDAQARVLPTLGLGSQEISRVGAMANFQFVDMFVRKGHRRKALDLFVHNLRGAVSGTQFMKTAARLVVPRALFQARRRRAEQKNVEHYGVVRV